MVGCRYMKKTLFLLGVLLLPSLALASFDVSLKIGSRGQAVMEMQDLLQEDGCLTTQPTGYFGFATLRAVKCFQTKYKLPASGYWGPQSRAQANKVLAAAKAESDIEEIATTGTTSAPIIVTPAMKVPPDTSALENKVSQLQAQLQVQSDQQIKIQQQQAQALQDANAKLQKIVEKTTEAPPVPEKIVVPPSPKPVVFAMTADISPRTVMANGFESVYLRARVVREDGFVDLTVPIHVTSTEGFSSDVIPYGDGMYTYRWVPKNEGKYSVTAEVAKYGLKQTFDYTATHNTIIQPSATINQFTKLVPMNSTGTHVLSVNVDVGSYRDTCFTGMDYTVSSDDLTFDDVGISVLDRNGAPIDGNSSGISVGLLCGPVTITMNARNKPGQFRLTITQIVAVGRDSGGVNKLLTEPAMFDFTIK